MLEDELASVSDKSAEGIAEAIQKLVHTGRLEVGTRLPPVRDIAKTVGVSPSTIGQAWKRLAEHGVIETKGRLGTIVLERESRQPWRQFRSVSGVALPCDLSTGFPDPSLLPDLAPYLRAAAEGQNSFGYDSVALVPGLREALQQEVPADVADDNVLLASHVIGLLAEVLPVIGGFRSGVIVGAPEFAPHLDLLERVGKRPCPVELDDEGLRFDQFEEAVDAGATAAILQPRVHNPTGIEMSPERLRRIALLCAERNVLIIESDHFGALSSSPRMTAGRWAPEQTLYIRAFSKDLHPDLRVVAAIGSRTIIQPVLRRRVGGYDVSGLNQVLLRLMLTSTDARESTRRAKAEYDRRRSLFIGELARNGIRVVSRDGFNVWVPVRSEQDALIHLAYNGISAAPGSAFQVDPGEPHLRVSIAAMGDNAVDIGRRISAAAGAKRTKG
jgi:DNA-binding transcriptional MocR family regulator